MVTFDGYPNVLYTGNPISYSGTPSRFAVLDPWELVISRSKSPAMEKKIVDLHVPRPDMVGCR